MIYTDEDTQPYTPFPLASWELPDVRELPSARSIQRGAARRRVTRRPLVKRLRLAVAAFMREVRA